MWEEWWVAEINGAILTADFGEPHFNDRATLQRDHHAESTSLERLYCGNAVARAEYAISCRRRAATLQVTCRVEKADGTPISVKTLTRSRPLKERTPAAFVQAQSANLAELSSEIAQWLPQPTPSSK